MPKPVRVRMAPSPTGNLHVGGVRTALYNYLFAHKNNGVFILRLEDTDELRSSEEFTKDIIDGFKWVGLNWTEGIEIGGPYGPYRQTEKVDRYNKLAEQLISKGFAYFCYCTIAELEAMKEEQKAASIAARYDNRCRHLTSKEIEKFEKEERIPTIRFKFEEPRVMSWNDRIKGEISISSSDLGGDLVIIKSSGIATYNFAVVVDDIDMKISHVIRGEEHIHNTAKQIPLFEALGAPLPEFAHVPVMVDLDHAKLSKRKHGEFVHVAKYRKDGYLPEAMINYLAQMSWTPPDGRELFTLEQACELFDLHKVSKSPAVFDIQRLNWFNGQYIRSLPLNEVTDRALPFLACYDVNQYTREELEHIVNVARDGLAHLSQIAEAAKFFFVDVIEIPQELENDLIAQETSKKVLRLVLAKIEEFPWSSVAGCKSTIDTIGKELGVKGKELFWPVRAVLTGSVHGPDLGSILSILGAKRVEARIKALL